MKIIKPYYEFIGGFDPEEMLKKIEMCGRVCYKSEDRITEDSAARFVKGIVSRGHGSVLEHAGFTVKFVCDRGVSHELVRHRIASFSQESTRYINYANGKFGSEITVIDPCFFEVGSERYSIWKSSCEAAEQAYFELLNAGCAPEEARSVLPNSLKTELIVTANVREWRHILSLRAARAAHPQARELMGRLLKELKEKAPALFGGLNAEEES
ncbi:MAG TPA: FAD-dependent thymidylate synthase [Clostridia bacterium]|nr:FAD-dependent thymidylate synthase [Clostridia bacterium]